MKPATVAILTLLGVLRVAGALPLWCQTSACGARETLASGKAHQDAAGTSPKDSGFDATKSYSRAVRSSGYAMKA